MLLRVPCNYPGVVKEITTQRGSSEVILALSKNPAENDPYNLMEVTVQLALSDIAGLALKRKDPVYAVILCMEGTYKPGQAKDLITLRNKEKQWVTIRRGPATEKQIAKRREKAKTDHSPPSEVELAMWANGYLDLNTYNSVIEDAWRNRQCCGEENTDFQIESILQPSPVNTWKTIPFGTDCKAKILNEQEKSGQTAGKKLTSEAAWAHGYATEKAYFEAFRSNNAFEVNGPTLAGFVCDTSESQRELFTSSGRSPGYGVWPVPVNLYRDYEKIGTAVVTHINVDPEV